MRGTAPLLLIPGSIRAPRVVSDDPPDIGPWPQTFHFASLRAGDLSEIFDPEVALRGEGKPAGKGDDPRKGPEEARQVA
jgi:hypothetical protein